MAARSGLLLEWAYRLSLAIKGMLGLSQLVGGTLLLAMPTGAIPRFAHLLTRSELSEDPSDPISLAFARWAISLGTQGEHFYGIYLLSHGALNFGVVLGLLLRLRGAYHLSLAVLCIFVAYQSMTFLRTHDKALLLLTAIDLVVIGLVLLERRRTLKDTYPT